MKIAAAHASSERLRTGGHETFHLRPGWLTKGMGHVVQGQGLSFGEPEVADALGVGVNMSKSIAFWLVATGLVGRVGGAMVLTPLGEVVWAHDPYLEDVNTWWALHLCLVTREEALFVFGWFFNHFHLQKFARDTCHAALLSEAQRRAPRRLSQSVLAKDLACLLQSYAHPLGAPTRDPEDATDCPLRQLELLVAHRERQRFERPRLLRTCAPEILGMALACMLPDASHGEALDVPLTQALVLANAPGRTLGLDLDALADAVDEATALLGPHMLALAEHGGERVIRAQNRAPHDWLAQYYARSAGGLCP